MARVLIVGSDALVTRSWVRALLRRNHEPRAIRSTSESCEAAADGWRFEVAVVHPSASEADLATLGRLGALAEACSLVALTGDPLPVLPPAGTVPCQVQAFLRPGSERELLELVDRCLVERTADFEPEPDTDGETDFDPARGADHELDFAPARDADRETGFEPEPEGARSVPKPPSGVRRRFPSNPPPHAATLPTVRVLVVDDDLSFANGCARLLATVCCDVVVATDGAEALALLLLREFDLVFCDLDLQRIGGATLLQELRARNVQVPFVLMSADGVRSDASRGSLVFLRKPIAAPTLLALVEEVRARPRDLGAKRS
ncbi:MAG: response regulator [Myxococcales bacterium]|nr:response regulator [Myxococcales bacterium]